MAPLVNDLLCYFTYVGVWRDFDPPDIVALKRKIDRMIHINGPLFSGKFFSACMDFQNLCFETYGGWCRTQNSIRSLGAARRAEPKTGTLSGQAISVTNLLTRKRFEVRIKG
jgi:hypothetical protein